MWERKPFLSLTNSLEEEKMSIEVKSFDLVKLYLRISFQFRQNQCVRHLLIIVQLHMLIDHSTLCQGLPVDQSYVLSFSLQLFGCYSLQLHCQFVSQYVKSSILINENYVIYLHELCFLAWMCEAQIRLDANLLSINAVATIIRVLLMRTVSL